MPPRSPLDLFKPWPWAHATTRVYMAGKKVTGPLFCTRSVSNLKPEKHGTPSKLSSSLLSTMEYQVLMNSSVLQLQTHWGPTDRLRLLSLGPSAASEAGATAFSVTRDIFLQIFSLPLMGVGLGHSLSPLLLPVSVLLLLYIYRCRTSVQLDCRWLLRDGCSAV